MSNINKVKELIINLEKYSFPESDFNDSGWSIDYQINLDNRLNEELLRLYNDLNLLSDSLKNNDLITAKCALIYARMKALDLSNFFLNIYEDIEKAGWGEGNKLPDVPEGYKIPDCYQYPSDK
ncbi:hypothetical protein [Moellerella wisconsensis]|uniref:Uncharacterized protein n=1 Tax=Moellerella wisconsensis ATCC 35017 TaxID=1354267 RepID=A0A0N0Z715_9GAMM|nr:hypothetical protein [Moellerella wisconsensis]KPD02205.1 hypothetical protein M992_2399 [Moellerella wisconsensis ATCC 35017]VFS54055.1 Uncharacterised protein [Moellerella wisconsensis]